MNWRTGWCGNPHIWCPGAWGRRDTVFLRLAPPSHLCRRTQWELLFGDGPHTPNKPQERFQNAQAHQEPLIQAGAPLSSQSSRDGLPWHLPRVDTNTRPSSLPTRLAMARTPSNNCQREVLEPHPRLGHVRSDRGASRGLVFPGTDPGTSTCECEHREKARLVLEHTSPHSQHVILPNRKRPLLQTDRSPVQTHRDLHNTRPPAQECQAGPA